MRKSISLFIIIFTLILISCDKDDLSDNIIEEEVIKVPEIKTYEVSDINVFSIKMGCEIIDQGDSEITEVGLVIGTSTQATVKNNFNKFTFTINDSGEYITTVTSLPEAKTTFYIRAYAINNQGIGYGNEVQFSSLGNKTFHGSITLSTQEEVIEFGSNNYNTIDGGLRIHGSVTELTPLKDLFVINNDFEVTNTSNLKNFKGLENLKRTGAVFPNGFLIKNNQSLKSFLGLEGLEITRGDFYVLNNKNLINLEGLDSFYAASAGSLRIQSCENLIDLTGLDKLEFIGDGLAIANNSSLKEISALSNLNFVPSIIYIGENQTLKNLNGLGAIKNIDFLYLNDNPSLSSIDAIKDCESLNSIKIDGHSSLTQLPFFENLTTINSIQIRYGGSLTNLSGFKNLKTIGSINFFQSNILSFEGLDNLEDISSKLEIMSCENIKDFHGLENLKSIGNGNYYSGLVINDNQNLLSFNGLHNLTNLRGSFNVASNNSLLNFDGLENLITIDETMHLHNNESLNNINAIANLSSLNGFVLEGNNSLAKLPIFNNLTHLEYIHMAYGGGLYNLQGLNNLKSVRSISFEESNIVSLDGLNSLENIEKLLKIQRCHNLVDLKGLENVTSIGNGYSSQGISINYNSGFKNLSGINSLTQIKGTLEIRGNELMSNLDGLERLTEIQNDIQIIGNKALTDFCSLSSFFKNYSFDGNYGVANNLKNPTIQDIKDGNCN
ncbi:hypothetical protein [Zunongwangia sp. HRR-M8]|uniref:hypothetical protein n=1 Tax=Zunongwangia sp. HRR-M8 TaxID=3015170 RepID=UPI0022DCF424|nr:hypothetical protein [Zunongwangia sp. HRR-M8]WBL23792.1 hypothetical protein PBT89_07475 [Zunongwangia sp. HRR-M8]